MTRSRGSRLSLPAKLLLVVKVWRSFTIVRLGLTVIPLPQLVARLGQPPKLASHQYAPQLLSRAVDRSLSINRFQPACLVRALVLYRLLREQGDPAQLVIGLPLHPPNHRAHAWVELDGKDVGPAPGRGQNLPLARFA